MSLKGEAKEFPSVVRDDWVPKAGGAKLVRGPARPASRVAGAILDAACHVAGDRDRNPAVSQWRDQDAYGHGINGEPADRCTSLTHDPLDCRSGLATQEWQRSIIEDPPLI